MTSPPSAIRAVADAYLATLARTDGTAAQAQGVAGPGPLPQVSPDHLDDRTDAARRARTSLAAATGATSATEVSSADADLAAALAERLDSEILLAESGFTERLLAPLATPVQQIRSAFDGLPRSTADDWEVLVQTLDGVVGAYDDYRGTLLRAGDRGHRVAARQVRVVAAQCRSWIDPSGADFFRGLAAGAPAALAASAKAAADRATRATAGFAAFLDDDLAPVAPTVDAVGRELYTATATAFLGAEVDVDELAAWGWDELDRIEDEIRSVARQIDPGGREAAIAGLDADPARRLSDDGAIVGWLETTLAGVAERIDGVAVDLPAAARLPRCLVSTTGAGVMYYEAPDPGLSRPGTVWWAREPGAPVHTWRERTTVHHEGIPGHHLQIARALTTPTLHPWQRALCHIHGYAEGWAHHSESWAADLGLLDDPGDRLGMLLGQAWRAARIVIDSGLHLDLPIPAGRVPGADRWTYDVAVAVLRRVTGLGPRMAAFEVDRYLGWPAQALAFRVGAKLFGEIRDDARSRPGWDERAFHDDLLGRGPMGLGPLRRRVLGG